MIPYLFHFHFLYKTLRRETRKGKIKKLEYLDEIKNLFHNFLVKDIEVPDTRFNFNDISETLERFKFLTKKLRNYMRN